MDKPLGFLLILTVLISACIGAQTAGTGRVVIGVTDAAVDMESVNSVMVTVNGISAHRVETDSWVQVSSETNTFDLLKLKEENSIVLAADANLDPGMYNQVRLDISQVIVTSNGTEQEAKLPSNILRINTDLQVEANQTSVVTFDFIADESLHTAGNGKIIMAPVIQITAQKNADVEIESGNEVEVKSGTTTHSAKVSMGLDGEIGVGVRVKATDIINVASSGTLSIGTGSAGTGGTAQANVNVEEFRVLTNDQGFFIDGTKTSSMTVNDGNKVRMTFVFDDENIYYSDSGGQGLDIETTPNVFTINYREGVDEKEQTVEFTVNESFKITSYWPAGGSKVKKADLFVTVR